MEQPDRNPVTLGGAVYFSSSCFPFVEPGPQWDDLKLSLPQPPPKCGNKSPRYCTRLPSPLSLVYKQRNVSAEKDL